MRITARVDKFTIEINFRIAVDCAESQFHTLGRIDIFDLKFIKVPSRDTDFGTVGGKCGIS